MKTDEVKAMAATSAFGMGIDKPHIRHIVRYSVLESLCSWVQELGRGGRDGKLATATILYSMSNTNHAMAWLHEHRNNTEPCERILKKLSTSWRYAMADLAGMCRHEVLLSPFGENFDTDIDKDSDNCCDVCRIEL